MNTIIPTYMLREIMSQGYSLNIIGKHTGIQLESLKKLLYSQSELSSRLEHNLEMFYFFIKQIKG